MMIFWSRSTKTVKPVFFIVFFAVTFIQGFMSSCKITQSQSYILKKVTRDTTVTNFAAAEAEVKIQHSDVLSVLVSSLNPAEDNIFNAPGISKGTSSGYQVSADGDIFLHKLGKVPVVGLTRKQLKAKLEQDLQPFFKDPVVTVDFENHRVTLLGDMGVSKVLNIPTEKISIFEALGAAGGTFENAKLTNVVVVRENGDKKEIKHLNLEDHSIFSSPWYYLQPNDLVVIVPDEDKKDLEQKRQLNQQIATFVLQGVSIAIIIYSTFFRR